MTTPTISSVIRQLEPIAEDLAAVVADLKNRLRYNAEARIGGALDQLIADSEKQRLMDEWEVAAPLLACIRLAELAATSGL